MSGRNSKSQKEYVESALARMWLVKVLSKVQFIAVVLCWVAIAFAIWVKFSGGRSGAVVSIAAFGGSMGIFSFLLGKYIEWSYARFEEVREAVEESTMLEKANSKSASSSGKIPLTVGFANLVGETMESTVQEDIKEISYLFLRSVSPPAHQIPKAEVLFVYANLMDNGTIGPEGKSGIRQVVQLTNSAIVIIASPNSPDSIKKAAALPGQKTANIVFTFDRNGREFGKFFRGLFGKMRDGQEMLSAWVELAPQVPGGTPSGGPQTLLIAEGGKIAFQREQAPNHSLQGRRP